MAQKLNAEKRNWEYLKNALNKGNDDMRLRQLCNWFFGESPNISNCAEKAYNDLKRRLKGVGDVQKISLDEKKEYKDNIYEYISKQIENLLNPNAKHSRNQNEFDKWHKTTCEGICEKSKVIEDKGIVFNYGHAQKWLNMTLKNMLVAETAKWWGDLNNIRGLLHVPVDQYVICTADFQLGIRRTNDSGKVIGRYTEDKYISWSKWNEYDDLYLPFQKKIRDAIANRDDYECPIDWEFDAWIAYKQK